MCLYYLKKFATKNNMQIMIVINNNRNIYVNNINIAQSYIARKQLLLKVKSLLLNLLNREMIVFFFFIKAY